MVDRAHQDAVTADCDAGTRLVARRDGRVLQRRLVRPHAADTPEDVGGAAIRRRHARAATRVAIIARRADNDDVAVDRHRPTEEVAREQRGRRELLPFDPLARVRQRENVRGTGVESPIVVTVRTDDERAVRDGDALAEGVTGFAITGAQHDGRN